MAQDEYLKIYDPSKQEVIKEFATKSGDTGSPEVQVALLSARISQMTEHLKAHINPPP